MSIFINVLDARDLKIYLLIAEEVSFTKRQYFTLDMLR